MTDILYFWGKTPSRCDPPRHCSYSLHQSPLLLIELRAVGRGAHCSSATMQGANRVMPSVLSADKYRLDSWGVGCPEQRIPANLLTPPHFGVNELFCFGLNCPARLKSILSLACHCTFLLLWAHSPDHTKARKVLRISSTALISDLTLASGVFPRGNTRSWRDMCRASCASYPPCHVLHPRQVIHWSREQPNPSIDWNTSDMIPTK